MSDVKLDSQRSIEERKEAYNHGKYDGFFFMALLFKNKWFIIITTLLATIVSAVISLMMPLWYASSVSVVPPKNTESGLMSSLGALSSTLKEVGLTRLGGGSNSESYTFMVILNSRTVVDSMINKYNLDKVYNISKSEMKKLREAFTSNCLVAYEKEGNYTITVWDTNKQRAADMANDYVKIANSTAVKLFREEMKLSRQQFEERLQSTDSTLNYLGDALGKLSSKTLLFSPVEQATAVSKAIADMKYEAQKADIMYEVLKKAYGETDPSTQMQKNIKSEANSKVEDMLTKPGFAGNFPLNKAGSVGIQYIRIYTEFETFTKVKAFLLPMIEKAKLDETKKLENLFVLDEAIPATEKDKPKRTVIVAGATVGGFAFSILMLLLLNSIRTFRRQYSEFKKETM